MIEIATEKDINALSNLWQSVFLEDKEVIEYFFKKIFNNAVAPVIRIDGEIVSSLFLLDCKISEFKGKCVYCAMTKYNHRGKGYMKKLLDFSYDWCNENDYDFLILVPAEKSLFEYYAKCGFTPFGVRRTHTINGKTPIQKEKLNFENELTFDNSINEYWKNACIHYGGNVTDFGLVFDDENIIIRNARGGFADIPEEYKKNDTVIQGDIDFGEAESPAMIKTKNKRIKNIDCYIGITLE